MRAPASIAGRLALASAVLIVLALIVASAGIGFTLSHFVRSQVDQRLDAQLASVSAALTIRDGELALTRWVDAPPFDRPRSGWFWQASDGTADVGSRSLRPDRLNVPFVVEGWTDLYGLMPGGGEGDGPDGRPLHVRTQAALVDGVPVTLIATAPMDALYRPIGQAVAPVALTILVLGLALLGVSVVQVRLGLRPLKILRDHVAAVRAGHEDHLPEKQPAELKPLVSELNRLIDQNTRSLERARGHVANLGHALNTPLASLALSLADGEEAADTERLELVRKVQERIRHNLARARAAALGGAPNARAELGSHVDDLIDALGKIHADRQVRTSVQGLANLFVACEGQDLDEMIGNLLDNAFKWGKSHVLVTGKLKGRTVEIAIEDDGPGMNDEALAEVSAPGQRFDESVPGSGFGLSITRDLAGLYAGDLRFEDAMLGGLKAVLELPAASQSTNS